MLIPSHVVEQLKAIDPDLPIYESLEGWITYLVSRINMGQQARAQQVYAIIVDSVFTSYDSMSELLRTKAVMLTGSSDEQNELLFWRIETSRDVIHLALKVGADPNWKLRLPLLPRIFAHFLSKKPAPVEWLNAVTANGDLRNADERTIAAYWRYTEQGSECWHHAIRELERKFEQHPMRAQLLLSIAIEKQHEALKREDPFKYLFETRAS